MKVTQYLSMIVIALTAGLCLRSYFNSSRLAFTLYLSLWVLIEATDVIVSAIKEK